MSETNHQSLLEAERLRKKEIRSKIGTVIFIILIIFFGSIYYILQAALKTENPIVVVTSGSMEPVIERGDLLIIKYKDPVDIKNGTIENKEGDIILFDTVGAWADPADEYVVHRVVGKYYNNEDGKWYFITKGDANPTTDPPSYYSIETPIPEDKIIGVVVGIIPDLGHIKLFLDKEKLTLPLTIILGVFLVISIVYDYQHAGDDEKDEKRKEMEKFHKKIEQRVKDNNDNTSDDVGELGI